MSLTTLDKNTLKREGTGIWPFYRCSKNDECVMATLVLDSDFQVAINQHNILSGSYILLRVRRGYFCQRQFSSETPSAPEEYGCMAEPLPPFGGM